MDKKKKRIYKIKRVDNMSKLTIDNISLKDFIKQNKTKIYNAARNNTKLNNEGKPTISRNDDWFDEDIWDEHYKKVDNNK